MVEDRDTILELTGKIEELQNEINCMNDSRGQSHVARQPVSFPPHPVLCGMLSRSLGMPSRKNGPPSIWDTHGISGNVFANPTVSSSSPYPGGFNPWIPNVTEFTSPHETSERQVADTALDPRCQSGPSARNSLILSEGRFSKDHGADQQRLQISNLHCEKFAAPATFACLKISFKTRLILSQSCNVVNPGKMFHSNSVDSHWWHHILCSFSRIGLLQLCSSKLRWIRDVGEPFRDTTQNPRRHRLLCVGD